MVKKMTEPRNKRIKHWAGSFGDDYILRNEFSQDKIDQITRAFKKIIGSLNLNSILEVGSNVGNNLVAIDRIFYSKPDIYAIEPNKTAYQRLIDGSTPANIKQAWNCDAFNIPLGDDAVDLVFTCGVLIHIHPDDLSQVLNEIFRVSRKYILCSEYFSHEPEEKEYHGQTGLLFKRDYGAYYLDQFKNRIECIDYGFLWQRDYNVFDNLNWWLFQKKEGA